MPTSTWVVIVAGLIVLVYFGYKYMVKQVSANQSGAGINRYITDITNLIGAADTFNSTSGSFTSRLGAFFGQIAS